MQQPVIAITPGEPAGIGPDICIQAVQRRLDIVPVFVADPALLAARAKILNLPLKTHTWQKTQASNLPPGEVWVKPIRVAEPVTAGQLNSANAQYVLETLTTAVEGCVASEFSAMVTAPVNKAAINDAGIPFTGHTEFLADLTQAPQVVMMLTTTGLRVALATTHIPLSEVSRHITAELLDSIIRVIDTSLKNQFGASEPNILVCGLNPHAGENGHLGREELEIIEPALDKLRAEGIKLQGPLPADTLFTNKHLEQADAVLAMYHDQGLPVLKHKGFGNAVNISLGLPIIRTSVDHGTALELAGTGQADCSSLLAAIAEAERMATHTQQSNR